MLPFRDRICTAFVFRCLFFNTDRDVVGFYEDFSCIIIDNVTGFMGIRLYYDRVREN